MLKPAVEPELQLLSLLSRPTLSQQHVDAASELFKHIDQDKIMHLIVHHRVWPCVFCNLKKHLPASLSIQSFNTLEKLYQRNQKKSRQVVETCSLLLRRFKELKINAKVLKGSPLAFRLYGDISKRHTHDLDLIIPEHELDLAAQALAAERFQCDEFGALTQTQKQIYFDAHKDLSYRNDTGTLIELHLRLSGFRIRLTDHYLHCLFNEPGQNAIQDAEFVYLCWHGSHTLFHRLKWLVDIALLIEQKFSHNNDQLITLARELHAMRVVTVSWMLSHLLFNVEIPSCISSYYQQDRASRIIVANCLRQLNNPKTINSLSFKLVRFVCEALLYQSLSEKIAVIVYRFKPTIQDIRTMTKLPARWSFLYYLFRPFLFVYRRMLITKNK